MLECSQMRTCITAPIREPIYECGCKKLEVMTGLQCDVRNALCLHPVRNTASARGLKDRLARTAVVLWIRDVSNGLWDQSKQRTWRVVRTVVWPCLTLLRTHPNMTNKLPRLQRKVRTKLKALQSNESVPK